MSMLAAKTTTLREMVADTVASSFIGARPEVAAFRTECRDGMGYVYACQKIIAVARVENYEQ